MKALLLVLLCFLIPSIIFSDIADDRAALLRLSSALRGNTIYWNRSIQSPCSWKGVTCNTTTNRVIVLRLPGSRLSGTIPVNTIGSLTELRILSLRDNQLSGQIPPDIDSCINLQKLFLQTNRFSGEIPSSLFNLRNLNSLSISDNNFSGGLSPSLGRLASLRSLYLERNQFTGEIPELNMPLENFNVSFNRFSGEIPASLEKFPASSFAGNDDLCGAPLTPCSKKSKLTRTDKILIGVSAGVILLFLIFVVYKYRQELCNVAGSRVRSAPDQLVGVTSIQPPPENPPENVTRGGSTGSGCGLSGRAESESDDELVVFGEVIKGLSLEVLLLAPSEVFGKGSLGTTYLAYLDGNHNGGRQVIVKRLKNVVASKMVFTETVGRLGRLYHENLLPIRAHYYGIGEKLLVFDFISTGSLSSVLHGIKSAEMRPVFALTWEIRSVIILQIASALEYLHSQNLTHGNIKSDNIFLTDRYTVLVSEFGLKKLVSSPIRMLNGYRAPELLDDRITSREADVFGFGILILEVLTGKDPTSMLNEEGDDLRKWVQLVPEERWRVDVVDPNLVLSQDMEEQLMKLVHLGVRCASQSSGRRPTMAEAVWIIKKICKR